MIRRGRAEGWLRLPIGLLPQWASLNGISFRNVELGETKARGTCVVASDRFGNDTAGSLLSVPRDVILAKENVVVHAKTDKHLQQVLECSGEFGRTTRGAILIFLLMQATYNCPDISEKIGRAHAFTEYVKFLHAEMLPTFWSFEEFELTKGTSLRPAIEAKMKNLHREFDSLRAATEGIQWCRDYWWDEIDGLLSFDDWLQVDCMYRSRALEFPGIGDAMVPCIDMANHASGDNTAALYEADDDGNGMLVRRENVDLEPGDEITITYGDEKGACELIFSYGFLEDMQHARDIFLDLEIPDDDPLKRAKKAVSTSPPGIRLIGNADGLRWEGEYIWLICVNEEDGLHFELARTTDSETELSVKWRDEYLPDTSWLRRYLQQDPLWNVYQLRAISLIQDRVELQLELIEINAKLNELPYGEGTLIREEPMLLTQELRRLERSLLELFYNDLERQKMVLAESETVQQYLSNASRDADEAEDDFS